MKAMAESWMRGHGVRCCQKYNQDEDSKASVAVNDTGVILTLEGAVTEVCWE